jgi:creatinine amidohydrolase
MPVRDFGSLTWEEVRDLDTSRAVALLPVGAVEAHGPHLPLITDIVIAEAMARSGAERLAARGYDGWILPSLAYAPAPFARGFPGTISVSAGAVADCIGDIAAALARAGVRVLGLANAHLDPAHLEAIERAVAASVKMAGLTVAFPNLTKKPWASRLSAEFKSGACHAGRFEGSIVLAARPELVRQDVMRALPDNPRSLSQAIAQGVDTFEAAGGPRAYFGAPAEASAAEGRELIDVLGRILEDAVVAAWDGRGA